MSGSAIYAFYYISLLIASLVSIWSIKNLENPYRILSVLILITSSIEIFAYEYSQIYRATNNFVYHFFTPVEFIFYAAIYKDLFKSKNWNKVIYCCVGTLILLETGNTIFFQQLKDSNTNTIIAESVLLVFLSLCLFIKISKNFHYDNLLKESIFWFNSAVLFFYSFSILIWGFHRDSSFKCVLF